jgi:hypothetical protein
MNISDERIRFAVSTSKSYSEAIRVLGFRVTGASFKAFKKRVEELKIDIRHFANNCSSRAVPLDEILTIRKRRLDRSHKKKIIEAGLLTQKCYSCGIGPMWNGEKLTLQIDHINGDCYDHRLENLQLLCPNCHSQTSNWGGRNIKNTEKERKRCIDCNAAIHKSSTRCGPCNRAYLKDNTKTKIDWSKVNLEKLVKEKPLTQIGKFLGVTDNAVRKRCIKLGIPLPKREMASEGIEPS